MEFTRFPYCARIYHAPGPVPTFPYRIVEVVSNIIFIPYQSELKEELSVRIGKFYWVENDPT